MKKITTSKKISGAKSGAGETQHIAAGKAGMRKAGIHPSVAVENKKKGGKYC